MKKIETAREYHKRFTGMKKAPPEIVRVAIDARITKQKAKKRLEDKKVRPHESIETWERRVRKYNLVSEAEIQRRIESKQTQYREVTRDRRKLLKTISNENRLVQVEMTLKEFDFYKYYGIIKQFYSVKFAISKVDLEICFTFYNNKLFTTETFNNICILNHGHSTGFMKRFKAQGYITELLNHKYHEKSDAKIKRTGMYRLSTRMFQTLGGMYSRLAWLRTLEKFQYRGMYPPEAEIEIVKMNQEINDYLEGNKKQHNINQ